MRDDVLRREREKSKELDSLLTNYFYDAQTAVRKDLGAFVTAVKTEADRGLLENEGWYLPPVSGHLVMASYKLFVLSFVLGMDHAVDNLALADLLEIVPDGEVPFEEALAFAKARVPLTRAEFNGLSDKIKFRAFTVARLTQIDAIEKVRRSITKATETGQTITGFIEGNSSDDLLAAAGFADSNPWYWENVYRTNQQTIYNAGRAEQYKKNPPKYLEFIGINDARQTDICAKREGIVRRFDDPFWKENWPPLHFQCRSTTRGVYAEEANVRGLRAKKIPTDMPGASPGFGRGPLDEGAYWRPTDAMLARTKRRLAYRDVKEAENKLIKKKEELPEFKTVAAAEKWAVDRDLADMVSFKGVKPEVARDWIQAVYDAVFDFPELRGNLKFVGTCQERNRALREHKYQQIKAELLKAGYTEKYAEGNARAVAERMPIPRVSGTTYAESAPDCDFWGPVQGVGVNVKFGKDPATWEKSLRRDVAQRYHPEACDTIKSVADHEIGHQLDILLDLSANKSIIEMGGKSAAETARGLSTYALKNRAELVAEGWAEFRGNPLPRPMARRIGEMVLKEYEEWEKKTR